MKENVIIMSNWIENFCRSIESVIVMQQPNGHAISTIKWKMYWMWALQRVGDRDIKCYIAQRQGNGMWC